MKTISLARFFLSLALLAAPCRAATETAISALPAAASAADADALALYVKSGSTYTVKRLTIGNLSLSLNAATATALQTPRTINGASFDGTANVTLPDGSITNAQLAGSIAAAKLIGSDLTTTGTLTSGALGAGYTIPLGTVTLTGQLPAANGGLPTQSGQSGKYLTTNGTAASWGTVSSGSGDVVGPASSVAEDVALFDGTSGKLLKTGGGLPALFAAKSTAAPAAGTFTSIATDSGHGLLSSGALNIGENGSYRWQMATGAFYPLSDNSQPLGFSFVRISKIYLGAAGIKLGDGTSGPAITATGSSPNESLVLTPGGTGGVSVAGPITIANVASEPSAPTGAAQIYAFGGEMKVQDASGNVTVISPHTKFAPPDLYEIGPGVDELSSSANVFLGVIKWTSTTRRKIIDSLDLASRLGSAEESAAAWAEIFRRRTENKIRCNDIPETFAAYEARTGTSLWPGETPEARAAFAARTPAGRWAFVQAAEVAASQARIAAWEERGAAAVAKNEDFTELTPPLYTPLPAPAFLQP